MGTLVLDREAEVCEFDIDVRVTIMGSSPSIVQPALGTQGESTCYCPTFFTLCVTHCATDTCGNQSYCAPESCGDICR